SGMGWWAASSRRRLPPPSSPAGGRRLPQLRVQPTDGLAQVSVGVRRGSPEPRRATVDENRFWSMIEAAWGAVGGKAKPRQQLAEGKLSEGRAYALQEVLEEEVAPALREQLAGLPADELLAFDRILERKLYDIDRADIHERTDGSDDGFLYCRGFIVG